MRVAMLRASEEATFPFGHQEGGSDLPIEKWLQLFALLLRCPVLRNDFHVASVRSGTIDGL